MRRSAGAGDETTPLSFLLLLLGSLCLTKWCMWLFKSRYLGENSRLTRAFCLVLSGRWRCGRRTWRCTAGTPRPASAPPPSAPTMASSSSTTTACSCGSVWMMTTGRGAWRRCRDGSRRRRTVSRHDIAGIWVAFFSRRQRSRCRQGYYKEAAPFVREYLDTMHGSIADTSFYMVRLPPAGTFESASEASSLPGV